VAGLCHLEGWHIHRVQLYVVPVVVVDHLVGQDLPVPRLWFAHALLVEEDDLRGSPVVNVDGGHPGLVHLVHCIGLSREVGQVLGNALGHCLLGGVKALEHLPLNPESLSPKIKLHHRLGKLGGHTTFVENHINLALQPL
jgi:hypothetical protein